MPEERDFLDDMFGALGFLLSFVAEAVLLSHVLIRLKPRFIVFLSAFLGLTMLAWFLTYLLERAECERDQAIEWYEGERPGLSLEFFERYEAIVQHARRVPRRAVSSPTGELFAMYGDMSSISLGRCLPVRPPARSDLESGITSRDSR